MAAWALAVLAASLPAAAGGEVVIEASLVKVRPGSPYTRAVAAPDPLTVARGEYESFQVVVSGPATVAAVDVAPAAAAVTALLHCVRYINVTVQSDCDGAVGRWPDPLVPAVDPFVGETRRCFPATVPAGENRAFWVDLWVGAEAEAGR